MKKIINMLFVLPLLAITAAGCTTDPIVFEHEQAQFETNENAVLLEVILPSGSASTDAYYIVGDFNGGQEEAVGDAAWQLQKAENNSQKWGIYLLPSTFVDGKTLADGYYFYSVQQGAERSVTNQAVLHKLEDAREGGRYNSWVDRWAAYFGNGGDDGGDDGDFYTIYVENKTTWEEMALYAWYADADVGPAWPGWLPTGTKTVNGIELVYWEMKGYSDKTMHLIFNNKDNGKEVAGPQNFLLERDLYLTLTDSGYEEFDIENPYKGFVIYLDDQTGWPVTHAYAWRTEITGPVWPGWESAGTKEINGVEYLMFRPGEDFTGLSMNLVFNNGGDNETGSINITLDADVYLQAKADGTAAVVDPNSKRIMYVDNKAGWTAIGLSYSGDGIDGTQGLTPTGTEEMDGVTYTVFEFPSEIEGNTISFTLNDGGSVQLAPAEIALTRDFYYRIPVDPVNGTTTPEEIAFRIYVNDGVGWGESIRLHYWGTGVTATVWPGLNLVKNGTEADAPAATVTVDDVVYYYFEMPAILVGKTVNMIFNNNGSPQLPDNSNVAITRDRYFKITATTSAATEVTP